MTTPYCLSLSGGLTGCIWAVLSWGLSCGNSPWCLGLEEAKGSSGLSTQDGTPGLALMLAVSWELSWGCGQLECQDVASSLCGMGFFQNGGWDPRLSIPRPRFQEVKVEATRLLMTSLQKSHTVTLPHSVGHTGLA